MKTMADAQNLGGKVRRKKLGGKLLLINLGGKPMRHTIYDRTKADVDVDAW